jgi:hypothetical protein
MYAMIDFKTFNVQGSLSNVSRMVMLRIRARRTCLEVEDDGLDASDVRGRSAVEGR